MKVKPMERQWNLILGSLLIQAYIVSDTVPYRILCPESSIRSYVPEKSAATFLSFLVQTLRVFSSKILVPF